MNKIKLLSAAILSLTVIGTAKAQFDNIKLDDIDQYHSRTLIVIIEKPSSDVTELLNKKHKDQVDAYTKAMDEFNKNFADAITQYWKVSGGEVQYKTLDDINDITDKKNYAVLYCRSIALNDLSDSYEVKNGIVWWPDFKEIAHNKDFSSKITVMGMSLLEKFNKIPIYQFPIPDLYPTAADLKYAVSVANYYIDYKINHRKDSPKRIDEKILQENQPILKDKTLLLRRDLLDKKLLPKEIEKDYPFPYMIAGKDTVEKAMTSGDTKYAVAMVTPDLVPGSAGAVSYVQYVYNIEDGAILASSGIADMPSAPSTTTTNTATAAKPLITKKSLMDFCLYIKDADDSSDKGKKKGKK